MGNFVLGILIPLPCEDPYEAVELAMKPYEGEGNKTDGWEILELKWSKRVDVTPYAYIAPDGTWFERLADPYPEEEAYRQQLQAVVKDHVAGDGDPHLDLLRQRREEVPRPVTDWHRLWHRVTHERMCIVAFVWCHC